MQVKKKKNVTSQDIDIICGRAMNVYAYDKTIF